MRFCLLFHSQQVLNDPCQKLADVLILIDLLATIVYQAKDRRMPLCGMVAHAPMAIASQAVAIALKTEPKQRLNTTNYGAVSFLGLRLN